MSPPPDEVLLARTLRGHQRSFATLVHRYEDRAYRLCLSILKDRELAEEALQDAFVQTWRKMHTFRGDAAFGSWFYRLTTNAALQVRRRTTRHHLKLESYQGQDVPAYLHDYRSLEVRRALIVVLARRSPRTRDILWQILLGATLTEAGHSHGMHKSTVRRRWVRAQRELQALL